MKKLLVSVIAIVLVAAVIGACFATYYTTDTDTVSVGITTSYQSFTLQIKNGANTGLQGAIALSGFAPDDRTKTVDLTLAVNDTTYVDGNKGAFGVSLTGDLATYITTTVSTLDAIGGNVEDNITTAAMGTGYKVALTSTPIYVRLSFYLNDAGVEAFATAAEKTASLSVTWTIDEGSVWTYSGTEYYLVGKINGDETKWSVTEANQNVQLVKVNPAGSDGNNIAIAIGVSLTAGDEIKVVYNFKGDNGIDANSIWYGTGEGGSNNSNVAISTTGTYNIYLYADNSNGGVYKVSAALQE